MSTDTGHNSSYQGTSWAYHNEESIADWGWRAMHESTVTSKVLVNGFYGEDSRYNYFSGCSVGGRQGLRALQLFPDDYDGVSAGAPAWWTTHNQLFALKVLLWNFPENSTQTIPESLFSVIGDEVLKQCDPQDGLTDNIISDPFGCNFDPLPLLCTANKTTDCLTSEQIDTTFKVYNDWVDVNQTFVFPHYLFGTESSWSSAIGTGAMSSVENQEGFAQDLLQFGPNWSYKDLTYKTVEYADRLNPGNATASEFDIRPFKARGGKLIHYQGYADPTLPTGSSIYFYEHVSRALTEKSATLDDFYRMFLIPGME
jgi:feruloyl esterase